MAEAGISLETLADGDFFHAECENGARGICLVTSKGEDTLCARVITSQVEVKFDLKSGVGRSGGRGYYWRVNSIKKVPKDIYDVFSGIDRKYNLMNAPEGARLLEKEIKALLFADSYYY